MEEKTPKNYQEFVEKTFSFLRKDKKILLVPFISFLVIIFLLILFIVLLYFFTDIRFLLTYAKEFGKEAVMGKVFGYTILGLIFLYTIGSFVNVFANAILIRWSYSKLSGKTLTIRQSLKGTLKHTKKLFIWGLSWGLVSLILNLIRGEYRKRAGQAVPTEIGFSFLGITWTFATYFVLPVLLIENKDIKQAIARSVLIFSKTWVKNIVGQFSIGFRLLPWIILAVMPTILAIATIFAAPDFLINLERTLNIGVPMILLSSAFGLTIIIIAMVGLVFLALQQIFFTVIYYYSESAQS